MICTGRSDYPNQVNNVLCFPYIFRGALDVGATTINEEMKRAAVDAIAALAREAPSDVAASAYGGEFRTFGPGSLIPNPFDPRLILRIAPAVAKAAIASGVATRPITDFATYQERLNRFVFRSGFIMKPVFEQGEDRDEARHLRRGRGRAHPARHAGRGGGGAGEADPDRPPGDRERAAGALRAVDPARPRFRADQSGGRSALPRPSCRPWSRSPAARASRPTRRARLVRTNATVIAALAVRLGIADVMICGVEGRYMGHLTHIRDIIGLAPGARDFRRADDGHHREGRLFPRRHAHQSGSERRRDRRDGDAGGRTCAPLRHRAEDRAALALGLRQLRVRLGAQDAPGARDRHAQAPSLEVDGEMNGDSALVPAFRERVFPHSRLTGEANVLIMPNIDAANIAYQMIKVLGRRASRRADPHRRGAAGAHPHAVSHGAWRRQYDGDRGGRGATGR